MKIHLASKVLNAVVKNTRSEKSSCVKNERLREHPAYPHTSAHLVDNPTRILLEAY